MNSRIVSVEPESPPVISWAFATVIISALYIVLTVANSFLCDDAFITFRYAKNLAEGAGPVFNHGERVEGYTSFLWMILMATVIKLGGRPELWSRLLSLFFGVGTVFLLSWWLMRYVARSILVLTIAASLAWCAPFVAWSSGGLEPAAAAFFVLASMVSLLRFRTHGDTRQLFGASCLIAMAILTRPETALVAVASMVYILILTARRTVPPAAPAIYFLPAVLLTGAHLLWRWLYYGKVLPNTFYAKSPGFDLVGYGAEYLVRFVLESGLWLPVAVAVILIWRIRKGKLTDQIVLLTAIILLFFVWIVYSGGDFMMMSRFIVPILPVIILLIAELTREAWQLLRGGRRSAFVIILLALYAANNLYALSVSSPSYSTETLDSIGRLKEYRNNWTQAATVMLEMARPTDTIATSAIGIIPYYTDLPTMDLCGLIATDLDKYRRRGDSRRPGHSLSIKPESFFSQPPQFFLGHPLVGTLDQAWFSWGTLHDSKPILLQHYLPVSMPVPGEPDRHLFFFLRRDIVSRYADRIYIHKLKM